MIELSAVLTLVGLIVTLGVTLTGIMFHWLRKDIMNVSAKIDAHTTLHLEGKV